MVTVLRHGLMVPSTRVLMSMARRTALANSPGPMVALIRELSRTITFRAMVLTTGLTAASLKVTGSTTKWKERVSLDGPTAEDMKENISMTRKKVTVPSSGPMAGNTKVAGRMESSTARASTPQRMERRKKASGATARELPGIRELPTSSERILPQTTSSKFYSPCLTD